MSVSPKKLELVEVDRLIPYARNARTHGDDQVAQIAGSIKEFGFNNPVLIAGDGSIIAGHGRVMAARKLGMKSVPCVRLEHLTDSQRRAYILADNKIALNSGWDEELLQIELLDLNAEKFPMAVLGFDANELNLAMGLGAKFLPGTENQQSNLDEKAPIRCPSCGHEFRK